MMANFVLHARSHNDPFIALPFMLRWETVLQNRCFCQMFRRMIVFLPLSHTAPEFKAIWPQMPWFVKKLIVPYVLAWRYNGYVFSFPWILFAYRHQLILYTIFTKVLEVCPLWLLGCRVLQYCLVRLLYFSFYKNVLKSWSSHFPIILMSLPVYLVCKLYKNDTTDTKMHHLLQYHTHVCLVGGGKENRRPHLPHFTVS